MIKLKRITDPFILTFLILIALSATIGAIKFSPLKKEAATLLLGEKINLVNKIEIIETGQSTILEKKGNEWTTENQSVDEEKINKLIETLKQLKKENLVSENKENQVNYGVDDKNGTKLIAKEGESTLLSLIIGYAGPDYEKAYIKVNNEDKVFLSNVALRPVVLIPSWKVDMSKDTPLEEATNSASNQP